MTEGDIERAAALEEELLADCKCPPAKGCTDCDLNQRAALMIRALRLLLGTLRVAPAGIELANEVAQVANGIKGPPFPHEAGMRHYHGRLYDALEKWRKAVGIEGNEWPIEVDK